MDTLTNIIVSLPDTIAIANTSKNAILQSYPSTISLGNVIVICLTAVACLLIIAITFAICFHKAQEVKKLEIDKKNESEKDKRKSEQNFKRLKDQYDSAWRTFEYMLNGKLSKDDDAAIKAEKYIKLFWGYETSEDRGKSKS